LFGLKTAPLSITDFYIGVDSARLLVLVSSYIEQEASISQNLNIRAIGKCGVLLQTILMLLIPPPRVKGEPGTTTSVSLSTKEFLCWFDTASLFHHSPNGPSAIRFLRTLQTT
jgi:hypothetical protein